MPRPSKDLALCEGGLISQTIPAELVHDLGVDFIPHRKALDADTHAIGVALNRHIGRGIEGNAFHILDRKTGKVIADTQKIFDSAKAVLTSHLPTPIADFEPRFGVFSPNTPDFIYSLGTSWNENCVIAFNYQTGQSHILARDGNTTSIWMRKVEIAHGRYIVSSYRDRVNTYYSFYDLQLGRNLNVMTTDLTEVRVSEDGTRLLQSQEQKVDRDHNVYVNSRFKLKKDWPAERIDLRTMKSEKSFQGAVIASSADLSRVVIDRNNKNANRSYEAMGTPWVDPDLALLRIENNGSQSIKALAGWKPVLDKIREAAKHGLIIPIDTVKGEMSADGKIFSFDIRFSSKVTQSQGQWSSAQLFNQNWIGLWNLNSGRKPLEITSKIFDSTGDQELNPSLYRDGVTPSIWNRKMVSRMLPSGLLLVARATLENMPDGKGDVHVKMLSFSIDGKPDSYIQHSTGPMVLDPTGLQGSFNGIKDLQIGASGRTVIFLIESVGTRLIDMLPN